MSELTQNMDVQQTKMAYPEHQTTLSSI